MTTTAAWLSVRRARFPRLRRLEPVGIVRNGGTKRVYECAFCHSQVSMCAKYPVTKRVREFCADHNVRCLASAVAEEHGLALDGDETPDEIAARVEATR